MISDIKDHPDFAETCYEVIEEGPASTVSRTQWVFSDGRDSKWVVVKTASTRRQFSKEPHDIVKEIRILSCVSHINIISVLGQHADAKSSSLRFFMPYVPYSLANLLSSPAFSPHSLAARNLTTKDVQFSLLAKSLIFQITLAVCYLHSEGIAHRDIKPHNILLTNEACVKLIDFGISRKEAESQSVKKEDLWPEYSEHMYFEVSTGPYRAPELLFGTRSYNAMATDLWSLGATLAEFFTPFRLSNIDYDGEDDALDYEDEVKPFILPKTSRIGNLNFTWFRESLFNSERGEIGLAWSIFRKRGTPTEDNWPSFRDLPHSSRVTFNVVPPADLSILLPNLPSTTALEAVRTDTHFPVQVMIPSPLDLVCRFLVYPQSERIQAKKAIRHPWFSAYPPVLLPTGYSANGFECEIVECYPTSVCEGKGLDEWLISMLPANS